MKGHIEPLTGILRIGGEYGQPYTWSATLRYITPAEVEVMGVLRAPTLEERRAIREVLRESGVERAHYLRINGTKVRRIEMIR